MEQERHNALFVDETDVEEWDDDGMWDKETQTVHTGELVADFFNEELIKDHQKVKYYIGLLNGELLMEIFKLAVPFPGNKREYYWKSFFQH